MSRQFDEAFEGAFEYRGETHMLVYPHNLSEVVKALGVIDMIDTAITELLHDDDSSNLEYSKELQQQYIDEYMEDIEDFDNSYFKNNLEYLLKKNGLTIGELEGLLHISAGYISRTTGENAGRRISIDILWKIAQLFGVSLEDLILDDLEAPQTVSESEQLVVDFADSLRKKTQEGGIDWISESANMFEYISEQKPDNPIFAEVKDWNDDTETYVKVNKYQSRFYSEETTEVSGNCYHASYNGKRVYINCVRYRMTDKEIMELEKTSPRMFRQHYHEGIYEVYIVDRDSINPICSTHFVRDEIKEAVRKLYEAIETSHSRIGLTDNMKSYMKQLI